MTHDLLPLAILVVGTAAGAAVDLRTRRVPNMITGALASVGLALAAAGLARVGVGAAFAGVAVGMVVMLPGYTLGATGAGDVKLLAAAGALLGPADILWAFLYTGIAGATLAILVAASRTRLRQTVDNLLWLVVSRGANRHEIEHPAARNRFAYAPAIAIGTIVAAVTA